MAAAAQANVGLKAGWLPLDGGWSDDMNANLRKIDALLQGRTLDMDLTAPPGSPAAGDVHIIAASATGVWAGNDNQIAVWAAGDDITTPAWFYVSPRAGWRMFNADDGKWYQWSGTAWVVDSAAGASSYSQSFGDGAAGSFAINHALATRDVLVTVYRAATPWEDIPCTVSRTTANIVTLAGFSSTPAVDQYVVVVKK
jgi:hypothetical protein